MPTPTYMMIDLETYSTRENALIWEAGWVIWQEGQPDNLLEAAINIRPTKEEEKRGHIDLSTIEWCNKQQLPLFPGAGNLECLSITELIKELKSDCQLYNVTHVISNGKDFDIAILNWWNGSPITEAWDFRHALDFRFVKQMFWHLLPEEFTKKPVAHNALDDARNQMELWKEFIELLRGLETV